MQMTQSMRALAKKLLIHHEGCRKKLYKDIYGNNTIAIGRNLDANDLRISEIDLMFNNDADFYFKFLNNYKWFGKLNEARKIALLDMCFNTGTERFKSFHDMFSALEKEDYLTASKEMLNSLYARQVKNRAMDLANIILTGEINLKMVA